MLGLLAVGVLAVVAALGSAAEVSQAGPQARAPKFPIAFRVTIMGSYMRTWQVDRTRTEATASRGEREGAG
jgi:hypothetical protein